MVLLDDWKGSLLKSQKSKLMIAPKALIVRANPNTDRGFPTFPAKPNIALRNYQISGITTIARESNRNRRSNRFRSVARSSPFGMETLNRDSQITSMMWGRCIGTRQQSVSATETLRNANAMHDIQSKKTNRIIQYKYWEQKLERRRKKFQDLRSIRRYWITETSDK